MLDNIDNTQRISILPPTNDHNINDNGISASQWLEQQSNQQHCLNNIGNCNGNGNDPIIPGQDHTHIHSASSSLVQFASFLHKELPIRLAHRIADLENVPHLSGMPSVVEVKECYIDSFRAITSHQPIENKEDESEFAAQLEQLYQNHSGVLDNMAKGAFELRRRQHHDFSQIVNDDIHGFLDRFHTCRIGIRVLAGQYLALRQTQICDSYVGMINKRTSPYEIVQQAIDDATFMCARKYGDAPDVLVRGRLDLTFPYVPTHLHYILLELLKNSMRATMDWHGAVATKIPPIQVVIADGKENEDVAIKVSDEGGGIPRSNMKRIWNYLFTTADSNIQEAFNAATDVHIDHSIDSPLAGLGYGLPISRSYARYFGGDLGMMSMEGFGTDAFVHLARLGNVSDKTKTHVIA